MPKAGIEVKLGDTSGQLTAVRFETVGKNKTLVAKCACGVEKVFWKKSAFFRQKSCGCLISEDGVSGKQRRSWNLRLQGYKNGAKLRNYVWELTLKQFIEIASKPCTFCGTPAKKWECFSNAPSVRKDSPRADSSKYEIEISGIDRLDNSKGYTLENCVPCCMYCNRAKSDMTLEDFISHVERLHSWLLQHHKKQK